jgi:plastocyanin
VRLTLLTWHSKWARLALAQGALSVAAALPVMAATVQVQVNDEAGKGMTDAIVFLESREAKAASKPIAGVEIAQVSKQFSPQVTVVTMGSVVQFPNRDTVRHHVYSFSPAKTFEIKLYTGTAASPVVFDRAGIAVLGCNIHDNMSAWVVIVETPYYGRSAQGGRASLANVPPGNYRLRVWHSTLPVGAPALDQALVVGASDPVVNVKLTGTTP